MTTPHPTQQLMLKRRLEFDRGNGSDSRLHLRVYWDVNDRTAPSDQELITLILDDDDIVTLVQNLLNIKDNV